MDSKSTMTGSKGFMHITQRYYFDTIVKRFGIKHITKFRPPAPADYKVSADDCPKDVDTAASMLMPSVTSSAACAQITHPEICYVMSFLSCGSLMSCTDPATARSSQRFGCRSVFVQHSWRRTHFSQGISSRRPSGVC